MRQQLAAKYAGLRTFENHLEMFTACPTDVVCVSTYPPSHETVALDALKLLPLAGILVEKPLGHTVASGRRILEAIKAKNLPMAVPHGLVAKRTSLEIIERVQQGEIGGAETGGDSVQQVGYYQRWHPLATLFCHPDPQ